MKTKKVSKKVQKSTSAGVKMRVSQGHVAKLAIKSIENLFKEMRLDPKATKHDKRLLIGTAQVPTQLIEEVAAAADQHGLLVGMKFDSNKAREALAYAAAFEPVATKAEAFAQRVRDSILAAKGETGAEALAVYASMKGIVRRPQGAPLRDSFDKMTQIMKQRRKKKPAAATATTTPPKHAPAAPPANVVDAPAGSTTVVVAPAPRGA